MQVYVDAELGTMNFTGIPRNYEGILRMRQVNDAVLPVRFEYVNLSGQRVDAVGTVVPSQAPSAPDLTPASDSGLSTTDNVTNVNAPMFTGTSEPNSTVRIFRNGTEVGSATANASGAFVV